MKKQNKKESKFTIDFFEFTFLVTSCIPPVPIARAMFWDKVIDVYYDVLTIEERERLFEIVNRQYAFERGIKNKNKDCLLFNARYDKDNQYLITTDYHDAIEDYYAFKWEGQYYTNSKQWIAEKYITNVKKIV